MYGDYEPLTCEESASRIKIYAATLLAQGEYELARDMYDLARRYYLGKENIGEAAVMSVLIASTYALDDDNATARILLTDAVDALHEHKMQQQESMALKALGVISDLKGRLRLAPRRLWLWLELKGVLGYLGLVFSPQPSPWDSMRQD